MLAALPPICGVTSVFKSRGGSGPDEDNSAGRKIHTSVEPRECSRSGREVDILDRNAGPERNGRAAFSTRHRNLLNRLPPCHGAELAGMCLALRKTMAETLDHYGGISPGNRHSNPAKSNAIDNADLCWREFATIAKALVEEREVTEIGLMRCGRSRYSGTARCAACSPK
ncbi:MAG: hypothetical protein WDN50_14030 [Bradyrhizobium sp.]